MKELSIEEKAKRYDEAIERAKGMHKEGMMPERIEYIFPELAESEDEKIRKDIISFVEQAIDAGYGIISKERKEKWIAWLEKQKVETTDIEDELNNWMGYEAFSEGVNITPLPKAIEITEKTARHFYELGVKSNKQAEPEDKLNQSHLK